jgi:hypothetical protein
MDNRARTIQTEPAPANAGTKQVGRTSTGENSLVQKTGVVNNMRAKAEKVALTGDRIEELKVTDKTYYVNDSRQPALSVRVSAGGVKAFVFTKFQHGKLTRITLGRVGALRLDAARAAVQKFHGEIAMGVDVGAARKAAAAKEKGETMQQAFQRFMGLKERRPSSIESYEMLWRLHVPVKFKSKPVAQVDVNDLRGIIRNQGEKHITANKVITLLNAILVKSGRWADNP